MAYAPYIEHASSPLCMTVCILEKTSDRQRKKATQFNCFISHMHPHFTTFILIVTRARLCISFLAYRSSKFKTTWRGYMEKAAMFKPNAMNGSLNAPRAISTLTESRFVPSTNQYLSASPLFVPCMVWGPTTGS